MASQPYFGKKNLPWFQQGSINAIPRHTRGSEISAEEDQGPTDASPNRAPPAAEQPGPLMP